MHWHRHTLAGTGPRSGGTNRWSPEPGRQNARAQQHTAQGPPHRSLIQKALHMLHSPLFLTFSCCLWSPTTSAFLLRTAHILGSCSFLPTSPSTRDTGQ